MNFQRDLSTRTSSVLTVKQKKERIRQNRPIGLQTCFDKSSKLHARNAHLHFAPPNSQSAASWAPFSNPFT